MVGHVLISRTCRNSQHRPLWNREEVLDQKGLFFVTFKFRQHRPLVTREDMVVRREGVKKRQHRSLLSWPQNGWQLNSCLLLKNRQHLSLVSREEMVVRKIDSIAPF